MAITKFLDCQKLFLKYYYWNFIFLSISLINIERGTAQVFFNVPIFNDWNLRTLRRPSSETIGYQYTQDDKINQHMLGKRPGDFYILLRSPLLVLVLTKKLIWVVSFILWMCDIVIKKYKRRKTNENWIQIKMYLI